MLTGAVHVADAIVEIGNPEIGNPEISEMQKKKKKKKDNHRKSGNTSKSEIGNRKSQVGVGGSVDWPLLAR